MYRSPGTYGIGLPELAEELAHVADEQIGRFHRREVSALLELREMNDLALRVHEAPHNRVGVEDSPPLRCRRRGQPVESVVSTLVIEPSRGTTGIGEPVDAYVGQQLVAVDGVVRKRGGWIGP